MVPRSLLDAAKQSELLLRATGAEWGIVVLVPGVRCDVCGEPVRMELWSVDTVIWRRCECPDRSAPLRKELIDEGR